MADSGISERDDLDALFGQEESNDLARGSDPDYDDLLAGLGDLLGEETKASPAGASAGENGAVGEPVLEIDPLPPNEAAPTATDADAGEELPSFLDDFEQGAAKSEAGGQAGGKSASRGGKPAADKTGKGRAKIFGKAKDKVAESEMSNRWGMAVTLLAALGLALGVGAAYMSYELGDRVSDLVVTVETVNGASSVRRQAEDGRIEQTANAVRELGGQMKEITNLIQGPLAESQQESRSQIEAVTARLTELEHGITVLREDVEATKAAAHKPAPVEPVAIRAAAPAQRSGDWVVNLMSYSTEAAADEGLQQLKNHGIVANKYPAAKNGKTWYRLRVTGFPTLEAAKQFGREAEAKAGLKETWVSREQ